MEQFPCMSPHFTQQFTHKQLNQSQTLESPFALHHPKPDMTTPYTILRCRMKDLISCFNACKLPIEKDSDESDHQKPNVSAVVRDDRKQEREKRVEVGTTSWQSCESEEDDDYIVFYFKDDDAGGEVVESSSGRKHDAVCCNRRKKENETGKIQVDAKLNEPEQHRYTLSESSDSSTGSFAFPTIQREWTGSPVLMPRPEGHNKTCGVCIQCCKF